MGRFLFAVLLSCVLANPALAHAGTRAPVPDFVPPAAVGTAQVAMDSCAQVEATQYWFCRGLSDQNCSVAPMERYWLCRAVTEDNCSVGPVDDFWFCEGITKANCGVVQADRYWLCQGIVRGDCTLVRAEDYRMCPAWQAAIRRLSS